MPIRYVLTKVTGQGEQITAEIAECNPITGKSMHSRSELQEMLKETNKITSDRMVEMNMAMLESYEFSRYFDPGIWIMFKQMVEVLYGRIQASTLIARWESAVEETAELERQRAEQTLLNSNGNV